MSHIPYSFAVECIVVSNEKFRETLHFSPSPDSDTTDVSFGLTIFDETTSPSPPPSLSEREATMYYSGLPSSPRLLGRTGPPWVEPSGLEAYRKLKQLSVVTDHELNDSWEYTVAPKVIACLDNLKVLWTSLDVVRIGVVGETFAPVVLWVGVTPKSLASEDAKTVAFECLEVLTGFGITDVEVELRESSVIRSAGPKLLPSVYPSNPIVEVNHPLTHALGLPIFAQATPLAAGTGGFFMAEGGDSNKLLLVTARHVVLPPKQTPNDKFEPKTTGQPRFDVLLLTDKAYEDYLESIKAKIGNHASMVEDGKARLDGVKGRDDKEAVEEREAAQRIMDNGDKAMDALYLFHNDVKKHWDTQAKRVLGHVVSSPPIRLGAGSADEQYTEDWAIIEIDDDKIDRATFPGNVLELGPTIPLWEFLRKMGINSFKYPPDRLLKLRDTISDEEMRQPTMPDQNDERCLMVIKNGSATGVTIGRASGIMSYVREYFENGDHQTSKEWPILPYDVKSGPFSAPGDSGAVIVDGRGWIGGLLTGGAGTKAKSDITYATPISFLLKSIKANGFPNAHLNL